MLIERFRTLQRWLIDVFVDIEPNLECRRTVDVFVDGSPSAKVVDALMILLAWMVVD